MKSALNILLVISFLGFLTSARSFHSPETAITNAPATVSFTDGAQLWAKNCAACHGPSGKLGPTWEEFSAAYQVTEVSEKKFVKDIVKFVLNPTVETSKMPEAVKKYKLMSKLPFAEDDIKEIAAFIHQTANSVDQ